jgi:DNA primase
VFSREGFLALISDETVLEVKRAVDIHEVISGYLPLKRAGASYKARCPFHEEKTPSFTVNPQRQTFKCFGCGKGGDAISFVREMEKVDYPDAIKILADKAGIEIKYKGGGEAGPDRRALMQAVEWASGAFRQLLRTAPEAEPARQFLARRGVSEETAETFGLGFAMESWDHLLQRARRNGTSDQIMVMTGLAAERDGGHGCYDFFRGRVMFPICDPRGKPIAFGARQLRDDDHPKFKNTRETAIFRKGSGFYGLHLAKEEFEKTRTAYIVEGYLDVIIPYQAGVKGLIATLGTAMTPEHLRILRRYEVQKVVLVFDADAAGQKASERGLDMLLKENVDIFVAELPAGMDPDDVVLKLGAGGLRECLEKPREIFDFLMESLVRKHGVETPAAKARIVDDMMDRVGQIPDAVKQQLLVQQLALRFNLEERTLRSRLARGEEPAPRPASRPTLPAPPAALETAARELLACALASAEVAAQIKLEVPAPRFPTDPLRKIAELAYSLHDRAGEISSRDLLALLRDDLLIQVAAEVVDLEVGAGDAPGRARACIETMVREESKAGLQDRRERLKNASPEEEKNVLRQVMEAKKKRPRDHGLLPGR